MGELMTKHMWSERRHEVIADTRKYVTQIIARYKSAYTYCILQQLRKNLSGKHEQALLLEQRKWQTYNRPLQSGYLYVLGGSEHRKWRQRFCVLQPDYTLEVYDSEEDFEVANKPRFCRKFSNFKVIDNVDAHYTELVKDYLRDFGYVRENVSHVIKKVGSSTESTKRPTQHVLALYHRYRGKFFMAAGSAVEKDKWLKSMLDAERQLSGVHSEDKMQREAFEFAIRQSCEAEEHCGISVNMSGTQEEITADFITDYLSNGCKTMLQTKVTGDVYKKFKMWEAISKSLALSVENIVKVEYPPLRQKAEEEAENLKQTMLLSMPRINTAYETASVEIIDALDHNFADDLEGKILPKIPELITKMGDLISGPSRELRDVFISLAESVLRQSTTSTEFANNIDRFFLDHLDLAPRNPEVMHNTFQAAIGKKSPFVILSETFPKLQYGDLEAKLCLMLQTLLDSAICTFQMLCGEAVQKNAGHLKPANITKIEGRVLKKLDHDNIVLTKKFLKDLATKITFDILQHIINYNSRNKLRDHEDLIPSEFKELMPIANVFRDSVLEKIEEELQSSVSAAFKRLAKDHFRMSRYHSSSTINSHSSNASDETNSTSPKHEPLSNQASLSETSSVQNSTPVVQILQENGKVETSVLNSDEKIEVKEDSAEQDQDTGTSPGIVMDGETGECFDVDEYGEPIPRSEVKMENIIGCDQVSNNPAEDEIVSQDTGCEDNVTNDSAMDEIVQGENKIKDEARDVVVESSQNREVSETKSEEIAAMDSNTKAEQITENNDSEVESPGLAAEDVNCVVQDVADFGDNDNTGKNNEDSDTKVEKTDEEKLNDLKEISVKVEAGHSQNQLCHEVDVHADAEKSDDEIQDDQEDKEHDFQEENEQTELKNSTLKIEEQDIVIEADEEESDADSSSQNSEAGSEPSPSFNNSLKESKRKLETFEDEDKIEVVTSFSQQIEKQECKEENNIPQSNGSAKHNGHSEVSSDQGEVPTAPVRLKKRSSTEKKENSVNIEKAETPPPCALNTDIEYTGVLEQIIHTGEEKLI